MNVTNRSQTVQIRRVSATASDAICIRALLRHQIIPMVWTMNVRVLVLFVACVAGLVLPVRAATNVFFNASQTATMVVSNINAVTIQSTDYRFTYSADGYWSASPGGTPTGRFFSVLWPNGVQAQAITAGPSLGAGANITVARADHKPFDMQSFTGKILLNTAGAGAAFEIMPQLNGNDAFKDPLIYDCSGYAGMSFSYTTGLSGYDTYKIHMWGDFALTALTLIDTNPPVPPAVSFTVAASALPAGSGSVGGAGNYFSNSTCALAASANPGWGFKNWTENGVQVSSSANYNFTVRSNRTLVGNFVHAFNVAATVSPSYGGTVSGSGTFNSNALVTVTATPNSGFAFVNWTEFGIPVSTAASYAFTLAADRTLVANFAPSGVSATFDFDTGTPAVGPGQGLPATQTQNGLTASFSTLAGGWSVQNTFYGWKPAVFSGNFLYPSTWGSTMAIEFSKPVTNFTMAFFTGEVSSEYDIAALVRVTAYTNTAMTFPVATGSARGTWVSGAYPEGTLSFGSATQFTKVKIEVPSQSPAPSYLVFVDNIIVQLAAPTGIAISATAFPSEAGYITGAGMYQPGDLVTLSAFVNGSYHFTNWTENGVEVATLSDYSFIATTNCALVANFTTNHPPFAFGSGFFQMKGQSLAINIADLMWNDYDPDGDSISFISVSASTSNGLVLATSATQILVPPNSLPDGFSYTIADGFGATATGAATISIITNVTSQAIAVDVSAPGTLVSFSGVPWYLYTAQRATNVTFTGTLMTWPVQAWADGSIYVWDDFSDLTNTTTGAFYRLQTSYP